MEKEIGKLTLEISPEALQNVIRSGRLLELADTMAKEAATQISAQIVDKVVALSQNPEGLKSGVSANLAYIFEGGEFGTVPPRPKFGPIRFSDISIPLRRLATVGMDIER